MIREIGVDNFAKKIKHQVGMCGREGEKARAKWNGTKRVGLNGGVWGIYGLLVDNYN